VATGQGVRIRYVAELDGLRGAAVAAVLLFHGGHLRGGYLGVDLFFVLSGYLITSLLLAESGTRGRIALGAFWSRRARRLLPALALMLIGVALYAKFVAQPADLRQIRLDGLATIGYVANWRYVLEHFSYWSLFTSPSPLQHTWSLAIEEQFYIVWPLVMVSLIWLGCAVRRRSPWRNESWFSPSCSPSSHWCWRSSSIASTAPTASITAPIRAPPPSSSVPPWLPPCRYGDRPAPVGAAPPSRSRAWPVS
jgi:peptidoglycan/LPS O-acetylase OafA/YrhL